MTALEGYRERLKGMGDAELRREWESPQPGELTAHVCLEAVEHEMAMRFRRTGRKKLEGGEGAYFLKKYMELPDRFWEAYCRKEWAQAKMLYDDAIRIGLFLEIPEEVRAQVMGSRQDPERPVEGLFPEWAVDKVMHECLIKNRLGHECVVYRVPGEIGFYGASPLPGTRRMAAWENPACRMWDAELRRERESPAYHAGQGRTEP